MLLSLGCTPDRFLIRHSNEAPIDGFIMQNIDSVDVRIDQSIIISSGGVIAVRKIPLTEQNFDMTIELLEGTGADFYFKTAIDKFKEHPNLMLNLNTSSTELFENNNLITKVDSIKLIQKTKGRLHIRNTGNRFLITYNCDTVKYGTTKVENSEFLIIKPHESSKLKLGNISIEEEDYIDYFLPEKK